MQLMFPEKNPIISFWCWFFAGHAFDDSYKDITIIEDEDEDISILEDEDKEVSKQTKVQYNQDNCSPNWSKKKQKRMNYNFLAYLSQGNQGASNSNAGGEENENAFNESSTLSADGFNEVRSGSFKAWACQMGAENHMQWWINGHSSLQNPYMDNQKNPF